MTGLTSRLGPAGADAAVAGALLVLAVGEAWWSPVVQARAATAAAAIVMTAALAFRRRWPTVTCLMVNAAVASLALLVGLPNVVFLVPVGLLALYSLGAYADSERSVIGLAATLVAIPLGAIRTEEPTLTDLTAPAVLFGAAWVTGRSIRARRAKDADLRDENTRLRHEREVRERHAAAEERARIARELHDIVAHRVTTIVIQAEAGAATADTDRSRDTFATIAGTGREALDELRRLLGVLRDDDPRSTAPPPGLAGLPALVEQFRRAGMVVEVDEEGDLQGLPAGVDLALYRIIQESLTNALRHSGASATLTVRRTADEVCVEVRNPVRIDGDRTRRSPGSGHGLAGMRERVKIFDGSITAGARDGQWVLRTALPLDRVDR